MKRSKVCPACEHEVPHAQVMYIHKDGTDMPFWMCEYFQCGCLYAGWLLEDLKADNRKLHAEIVGLKANATRQ